MTDDPSIDWANIPGYDPATGEIHDDPELEVDPTRTTPPFGEGDPPDGMGGGLPGDWQGEGDPEHGDSFVAEHPELFGGGEPGADA